MDFKLDPHHAASNSVVGYLLALPSVALAIKVTVAVATVFLIVQVVRWWLQSAPKNPFSFDDTEPKREYVLEQRKRDAVIKQAFSSAKVPENLDAIVIGSGIGGLTTAAILAKAGQKVLVLEQHDQAGGCCHTFVDKGYEFDVGIHYIGDMGAQTLNKTLLDQISQGQVQWAPLEKEYDVVSIGSGEQNRKYPVASGRNGWKELLKEQFPDEHRAIDEFFRLVDDTKNAFTFVGALKLMPLWLSWLVIRSGLVHLLCHMWRGPFAKSTLEVVRGLTKNKDLQTVLCYSWGDYGCPPHRSHFLMQALLTRHYQHGGYYPVGGASELAFNIIPVIERAGGQVFVRAEVEEILYNGRKAVGVKVKKGTESHNIYAPAIISNAGVYNTFERLLPLSVTKNSYYERLCSELKPGVAAMSVFLGLNASSEELGLKAQNTWAYLSNDCGGGACFDEYMSMDEEKVMSSDVPLLFISFPSTKDPNWKLHEGRQNKSTCAIITLANWEWYKKFESTTLKKRGDSYDELKTAVGNLMIEQTCKLFPEIKHHIDYIDIGSPVTNKYYIAQPHGEIYGLDHSMERFDPWVAARLRPETDIPGLYLTGQDVLTCGFGGAIFAGLLTAGVVLGRNAMSDLVALHKKLSKEKAKKQKKE